MHTLVATQQADLRLAIELYLAEEPGVEIIGTASEATSLCGMVRTARPDLIVLDWDLPGHPPGSLLAEIKMADRLLQVIVLCREAELKPAVLAAGADASVLKGDPPSKLLAAVRQARSRQALEIESNPLPTDSESGLSSSEAE